jgi:hypothetical protein
MGCEYSSVPEWTRVTKLTKPLVGLYVVVISRFATIAVPIQSSAMRLNAELLVQSPLGRRAERGICKTQAPISRKFHIYHFFDLFKDSVNI